MPDDESREIDDCMHGYVDGMSMPNQVDDWLKTDLGNVVKRASVRGAGRWRRHGLIPGLRPPGVRSDLLQLEIGIQMFRR